MAIAVNSIIERAGTLLLDEGATRWTDSELLKWLNDGQRQLAVIKDAKIKRATKSLAQGAKQTLPADCCKLMGVDGPDGSTVLLCLRTLLDSFNPGWSSVTDSIVTNYMYDPAEPSVFFVYPAQESNGTAVELTYSAYPVEAVKGGQIDVPDKYADNLLDYVLFRAYSKDAEFAGAAERAAAYFAQFSK